MQKRITKKGNLLDKNGYLTERGYATELILDYDRKAIKAPAMRIKEWDYYYIGNNDFGIALTIADNSYMALMSVSLLDFNKKWDYTNSPMAWFTMGKVGLPSSSVSGDVGFKNKAIDIQFKNDGKTRILTAKMPDFYKGKPIDISVRLTEFPDDTMVIATPFPKVKTAFYYNQKINCMRAEGYCDFDGTHYEFNRKNNSMALLDWGRGVWTYKNTWYWGSLSTRLQDGHTFGFNIGYGFGDTSAASENMLFYDGKAHKLSQVKFNIPVKNGKDDFTSPWTFTSDDGRFEFDFVPVIDRASDTNVIVIRSNQHQVFGKFYGKAILDDGTVVTLDGQMGFAEKVANKW